jgi:hypothetical protein
MPPTLSRAQAHVVGRGFVGVAVVALAVAFDGVGVALEDGVGAAFEDGVGELEDGLGVALALAFEDGAALALGLAGLAEGAPTSVMADDPLHAAIPRTRSTTRFMGPSLHERLAQERKVSDSSRS